MPRPSPAGPRPLPAPTGRALRFDRPAAGIDSLRLAIEPLTLPEPGPDACVIEIVAAGVNPSDAKAALGAMPRAVWPRTPGRDFAGVVRQGPARLIGLETWGSGGDRGITRDGTHATHLVLPADQVGPKPANLSLYEAAGVGVPFVTAAEGLAQCGGVRAGDIVLVLAANGKVGQAAVQLAAMAGGRVFAAERRGEGYRGHAAGPVEAIDASRMPVAEAVRERTAGHGADIVFNTVGSPYFEAANQAMAHGGCQILISTVERLVKFDIFAFYRGRHRYIGVDSLALDSGAGARILEALRPGFESGALKPFPIEPGAVYPLERAVDAYRAVLAGAGTRVLLEPRA